MPYLIGAPQMNQEVFVPNTNGQFIPDFMDMMRARGDTFNVQIMMPESAALNPSLARDAGEAHADSFEKRIEELRQSRGG